MAQSGMNCPNCGAALDWRIGVTRMRDCEACGATCFLDGELLAHMGERGAMADAPSLFAIGSVTRVGGDALRPLGHARFDYGLGWWDEFWCEADAGTLLWVSVDEGDIAIQEDVEPPEGADAARAIGDTVVSRLRTYTATEAEDARCIAVRGELPEVLFIGETHRYLNFSGSDQSLLSCERWTGEGGREESAWHEGRWLDPWDAVRES